MSTKYRDLYKEKVRGAVPITDEEQQLFELAEREREREELADTIAERLSSQQIRPVGAPRKTGGDVELVDSLMARHRGDTKLVRREFSKLVCDKDDIQKKRAGERFRTAFNTWKGLKT